MIVAGTGHRPDKLGGHGQEVFDALVDTAMGWLQRQGIKDIDFVISGMALGWDQALAMAAYYLKIPFDVYIPCLGQDALWPEAAKRRYRLLCRRARDYRLVGINYSPEAMMNRNKAMVRDCDVLLAMWDGSAGGTGNCISYAESKGRPIINLYEEHYAL